jgi:hypothetical protein
MAEDWVSTYLPWIMTTVIGLVVAAVAYFARQNATTVGGTIRLESVQGNVEDIKGEMNKGFNEIKTMMEKNEIENRAENREMSRRV